MDGLEKLRVNFKTGLMSVVGGGMGGILSRWSLKGDHAAVVIGGVLLTLGMICAGMWIDRQAEKARDQKEEREKGQIQDVDGEKPRDHWPPGRAS